MWKYTGKERPPFAEIPKDGQESVWDYPRPPIVIESRKLTVVSFEDKEIARTNLVYRLCETASPPQYYILPRDINFEYLSPTKGISFCEWKGAAQYWKLSFTGNDIPIGWSYEKPNPNYKILKDCLSFYPGRVDCYVNGEKVRPQPGEFYGGWITDEIVGPVKGEPGTGYW